MTACIVLSLVAIVVSMLALHRSRTRRDPIVSVSEADVAAIRAKRDRDIDDALGLDDATVHRLVATRCQNSER